MEGTFLWTRMLKGKSLLASVAVLLVMCLANAGVEASPQAKSQAPSKRAAAATTQRPAPPACCTITAIDEAAGIVTAKVNATGQTFQFTAIYDAFALVGRLSIGQSVYANLQSLQVSLDGVSVCCKIVSSASVRAKSKHTANQMVPPPPKFSGAAVGQSRVGAATANPACCTITAINLQTATVKAKVNISAKIFDFSAQGTVILQHGEARPTSVPLVSTLSVGQPAWANFSTGQVSLDGTSVCCWIIVQGVPVAPAGSGMSPPGQNNGNVVKIVSIDRVGGKVSVRSPSSDDVVYFNVPPSTVDRRALRVGQNIGFSDLRDMTIQVAGESPCPCGKHYDGSCACACGISECEIYCAVGECRNGVQSGGGVTFQTSGGSGPAPMSAGANPACCTITGFNEKTGNLTARVNANGQTFQFRMLNPGSGRLRVGQSLYANFRTNEVSLDGTTPSGTIVSVGPVDAFQGSVAPVGPVDAAKPVGPVDAAKPAGPCCDITGVNVTTGVITARVNSTGQTFQFGLVNQNSLKSIKVGQRVSFGGGRTGSSPTPEPMEVYVDGVDKGGGSIVSGGSGGGSGGTGGNGAQQACATCQNNALSALVKCLDNAFQQFEQNKGSSGAASQLEANQRACHATYSQETKRCPCGQ